MGMVLGMSLSLVWWLVVLYCVGAVVVGYGAVSVGAVICRVGYLVLCF